MEGRRLKGNSGRRDWLVARFEEVSGNGMAYTDFDAGTLKETRESKTQDKPMNTAPT